MPKKSGNSCIFCLFSVFNIALVGIGLAIASLGVYDIASISEGLDVLSVGLVVAGVITLLIGVMGFCSKTSKCVVVLNLFLQILLLCVYMTITVFYWAEKACKEIRTPEKCKELEDALSRDIIKWFLLAVDGSIVILVCERIVVWDYIGLFL